MRKYAIAALALAALVALAVPAATALEPTELDKTIADVQRRWPNISHTPGSEVQKMIEDQSALVFDVRTKEEYGVSHIPGSMRVDPAIDSDEFLSAHAAAAKGKKVVFYCSVGVRSSKLAERVGDGLKAAGASEVHNLKGGIFAWHGEARPLVDAKGEIESLHPYNSSWGKAVKRQDKVTTEGRE